VSNLEFTITAANCIELSVTFGLEEKKAYSKRNTDHLTTPKKARVANSFATGQDPRDPQPIYDDPSFVV
jgi:hypothetical protein